MSVDANNETNEYPKVPPSRRPDIDTEITTTYVNTEVSPKPIKTIVKNESDKKKEDKLQNTATEASKFTLQIYGEKGVKLFKNAKEYFSFEKDNLSGVKLDLKDNDYIDIGDDEDFKFEKELNAPTIRTVASNEIRMKKRRLRLENKNDFPIIAIAKIDEKLKTYLIGSNSESFIFYGKQLCRLYMYRGNPEPANKSPILCQEKEIIIYPAIVPNVLSEPFTYNNANFRINGKSYDKTKRVTLKNSDTLKFSIDRLTKPLTIEIVVGSDPSNPNILITEVSSTGITISDTGSSVNSTVIRPGGVQVLAVKLNSTGISNTFRITHTLLKKIRVYETTRFIIPINAIPYIRMKGEILIDVLNGTLNDLKNAIKMERELQDPNFNDCDALFQMVYTTYSQFKEKDPTTRNEFAENESQEEEAAWFFAVLFSHQLGMELPLVYAGILLKMPKELALYKTSYMVMGTILKEKKKTTEYKTKVVELMGKDSSTFLFELNISDLGFIACMYRPVKEIKEEQSGLIWLSNLLKHSVQEIKDATSGSIL